MKKAISFVLLFTLLFSLFIISVSASENDGATVQSIEVLEDGSYYVIEIHVDPAPKASHTTSGSKTATYYSSSNTPIWSVTVNGSFTYNYSTSSATSASGSTAYYVTGTSLVSSGSYTSGNSATAYATVRYQGNNLSKSVTLSCDKYGNLS